MNPFGIALIAVNLVVPYWIWSANHDAGPAPRIEWQAWTANMKRLVESSGESSCRSSEMVDQIRSLCHQSEARHSDVESVVFEQVLGNVLFSCVVNKDHLVVRMYPYTLPATPGERGSHCGIRDRYARVDVEPEFLFTYKGFVNTMSFNARSGERQSITVRGCRQKLRRAKTLEGVKSLAAFETELGPQPGDPGDFHTANRLCLSFDMAPGWAPLRAKLIPN